jgi:tetratricopeptide (TPR) repeat protein
MNQIAAFVGHSFADEDEGVVRKFLEFVETIKDTGINFTWDHATKAEPKELSQKIREKMQGKNLFIGICTAKERVISLDSITFKSPCKTIFRIPVRCQKDIALKSTQLKTSDWILQEIGFAFGKDMTIILLVEEGLRDAGCLQGNLERIPFNRDYPDKSFTKLLQMISSLKPHMLISETHKDISGSTETLHQDTVPEQPSEAEIQLDPQDDWNYHNYWIALLKSIFDENREKEDIITSRYLDTEHGQRGDNATKWDVMRVYYRFKFKKDTSLVNIENKVKEYPNNYNAHRFLALAYESFEEFAKAGYSYLQASQFADDIGTKFESLYDAARMFVNDEDVINARLVLEGAKNLVEKVDNAEVSILDAMARIADIENNTEDYLAFNEKILDLRPDDFDRRFSLAYKYTENKQDNLALFHYKVHVVQKPGAGIWNNIGVAQSRLKLESKSVEAYRNSEKMGGTLAMSNLAHKYIGEGFLDEAEEICQRATNIPDYDKQIGSAISSIKEMRENDEKNEQEILERAKKLRLPYVEYAHACTKKALPNIEGIWRAPVCELKVVIKDGKLEAKGSYQNTNPLRGLLSPAVGPGSGKMEVSYSGDVLGQGIRYTELIKEEGSVSKEKIEGTMVVSDDLKDIIVYPAGAVKGYKWQWISQ